MGSSPLARGPLIQVVNLFRVLGLIPARAGTTVGENGKKPGATAPAGSSPLARGPPAFEEK